MYTPYNTEIRELIGKKVAYSACGVFQVRQVDSLRPNEDTLMFINKSGLNLEELDHQSYHCVYLVDESYSTFTSLNNDFIRVKNPKYLFARIIEHYGLRSRLQREFERSEEYYNPANRNFQCQECIIGLDVQLDRGVILGGTDFSPVVGSSREELIQFPQMGGVILGDHVVVKYNTMIGKGTFDYTRVGSNTMIDYGCQIGHNCQIGKSCIIAAGTIIGGSTVIGDCTTIGIGAKIRNGLKIGSNVSIGMGAVVIRDVPDNCVVVGNPARIIEHKHIIDEGGLV